MTRFIDETANGLFLPPSNLTFSPTTSSALPRDLSPPFRCHLRRPRLAPTAPEFGGGALSAVHVLGFLAGRDPHDLDGSADHVSGALLASGSAWHQSDFAGDSYTNLPPSLESKKLVNVGRAA
jgi:hypothetical protein